jgi:very-short-patch-repair endonuclease
MAKLKSEADCPMYFGASPELLRIACELRKTMTPAEIKLWDSIRKKQLNGFRFRRQHPLKIFIVDFFCFEAMLAIEVDGAVHDDVYQHERDIQRTRILKKLGIKELRFRNEEIFNNIKQVLERISAELTDNRLSPTHSLP